METRVFVQNVAVEVELDRRLRSGDALIVEARQDVRDGELVVADGEGGAVVGRYAATQPELLAYPLEFPGAPQRLRRDALRVRGVVIGLRSAL
jgi:SOS-response transcriptional repressor LexA